jgi:hypothetical protein
MASQVVEFDAALFDADGWFSQKNSAPRPVATEAGERYIARYLNFLPSDSLKGLRVGVYQHSAVGRDVLIVAGSAAYTIGWGPLRGRPILSSKINTVLQLLYILLVVTHAGWGQPPATVLQALAVATFATVAYSGVAYLWEFTHRALQPAAPSG